MSSSLRYHGFGIRGYQYQRTTYAEGTVKFTLRHRSGLLAWYTYPISTGPLEGTNNKINTLQRQAYGFPDQQYFRLKIDALHETKYALIG